VKKILAIFTFFLFIGSVIASSVCRVEVNICKSPNSIKVTCTEGNEANPKIEDGTSFIYILKEMADAKYDLKDKTLVDCSQELTFVKLD